MISVVVVCESDLDAKVTGTLIVKLCARFRRFIHRYSSERITIVSLLFERSRKRASGEGKYRWIVTSVRNQQRQTIFSFSRKTLVQQRADLIKLACKRFLSRL